MPTGYLFILVLVLGTPCQFVIGATSASMTLGTSTIEANSSGPPYSNASSSYSYDFYPGYLDCNNYDELSYVGDGHCDTDLNTATCGWDGGDCCVCTCTSTAYYCKACPDDDRDCEDPLAPLYLEDPGCQNISFQALNVARCLEDQVYEVINDTAGATALAEATLCSGGYFEVEWIGHVDINKTIHVLDGTRLHIKGISNAVADGRGMVQIFLVHNASLILNNIEVFNGASFEGGAIILAAGSNLLANNVAFKSNIAYTTGGAVYAKSSSFELVSTTFVNNSAEGPGGAIYSDSSEISLTGTTLLERNKALYGGALYLNNGAAVTSKGVTIFESNEVVIGGGAIGAANGGGELRVIGTTNFTNNKSGENGGAIELSNIHLVMGGNLSFSHNSARFGGALYAFQVDDGPKLTGVTFSKNTAESGGAVFFSAVGKNPFIYSRYNDDYSAHYASRFDDCRFDGNSASSTGGAIHSEGGGDYIVNTTFVGNWADIGGAIKTSGLSFFFNSSFEDNRSGPDGGPAVSNSGVISDMSALVFAGNGYVCSPDTFVDFIESIAEYTRFAIVCDGCDIECEGCTVENGSAQVCSDLLNHTSSQRGRATLETLLLDLGYWRETNKSRDILECFNPEACLGGLTGSSSFCSAGYAGPYCATCSQGYINTESFVCSECAFETAFGTAVSILFFGLAGLLMPVFVYYMTLYEGESTTWQHPFLNRLSTILAVQSFKIIIVNWQIINQFSDVTGVAYANLYQELLDAVVLVNFDFSSFLSAWCIDVEFYNGLIIATTGPFAVMVLLGVTYAIALRRNRGSDTGQRLVRQKHINAVIVLAFLVYLSASSSIFRMFACNELHDGNVYFMADYRITCTSSKHRVYMIYAGSLIAVYPLGIPVLFAILLFRNRKFLENAALRTYNGEMVLQSTSSLWKPYKPSVFYYEVVECARRLMLGGITAFLSPDSATQIAATLAMAIIFSLVLVCLNPYESCADTWVARIGSVMVVLTMFVALLTKLDVLGEGSQCEYIITVVIVIGNIIMVSIGIIEAVRVVGSVQQHDIPLPGLRFTSRCPVDSFPSINSNYTSRRLSGQA